MAKKSTVNKSQAVRDYLAAHPGAMPKEIMAALAQEGIKVSRVLVSTVKTKLNKAGKAKKAAKPAAVVAETPAPVAKAATNGGSITLEQIRKVAQTINLMGGFQHMVEILDVIKEAGGVKKFRDLAEAMSCPVIDDIPY